MIAGHIKRALDDLSANRILSLLAVATIALSVLMVSLAALIALNTDRALRQWQKSARIMAYLNADGSAGAAELARSIRAVPGVDSARFIARDEALSDLKARMAHGASLLANLAENPLPDAFEISLRPDEEGWERLEGVAGRIRLLPGIEEVEYGQQWFGALRDLARLLRTASLVMTGLFFIAALAIVANTIRLVVASRREEVDIMRLVGASEGFIRAPFYISGMIQALAGAAIGLAGLFALFDALAARAELGWLTELVQLRFLSPAMMGAIIAASMVVGALGSHLSLRRN
ncbi:MAG: ABC transporter permease [Desulfobacterales bacterium]|jgi:cell division transport system permease protein|nr:ABC transporter permease [Desulfobacterales bacterium]